jgi:tRNA(Ile)-lysidine synthase
MSGLLSALRTASDRLGLRGRAVLVATSGGLDSTVLAHGLEALSQELDLNLAIGHVNHGLRADADADQEAVAALAHRLGRPFHARRVDPERARASGPSRARPSLQEAARAARYRALEEMARAAGAERIATAHTADDQAETVLLRVLRGTGPSGLAGIPASSRRGRVVRPLLRVFRAEVETFARERGLSWREDPSNRSERWLPGLAEAFNPRLLRALVDLAEAQGRDEEWIQAEVGRAATSRLEVDGEGLWIEGKDWATLPEALARRLLRLALHRVGGGRDVSRVHLARADAFLKRAAPGRQLELPGGLVLDSCGDRFRLSRRRC